MSADIIVYNKIQNEFNYIQGGATTFHCLFIYDREGKNGKFECRAVESGTVALLFGVAVV